MSVRTIDLAPPRSGDWEEKFADFLASRSGMAFEWGRHDCALFGADVVAALTGEDFGAPFRGRYSDAKGAAKALREHGAGTIVRTFDRHLKRIHRSRAQRGDLVLRRGSIGVVIGRDALFVGEEEGAPGLVRFPVASCSLAWRV